MKSRLTLSLPEATIRMAKHLAKARKTTISALFATSIQQWAAMDPDASTAQTKASPVLSSLLGALHPLKPFDAKSTHIRSKHV